MSDVMTTALTRAPIGPEVEQALESEPLSKVLRDHTWGSHERAEFSDFEQALVKGKMKRDVYAYLLSQVYFVYDAIEQEADRLADDPVASMVIFPEVHRTEAVAADLEYYYGENWEDLIAPLPITQEYVDRIHEAAADSPAGYVAHNYTRYLADLSGGLHIDRAIKKAYDLDEDGRRVYIFDGIDDATAFKNTYRGLLDELPIGLDEKKRLIEEALVAYEFNIVLNDTIAKQHEPFTIDEGDAETIDLT